MVADNTLEYDLRSKGYMQVAGVDEVGRGALAGPVVAAAVIFPTMFNIEGLNDSKKLTHKKRVELAEEIRKKASAIGVGIIDNYKIDKYNILQATFMAMKESIKTLPFSPNYILVDGQHIIPQIDIKQSPVIKGDAKSISIAAASIIAKVTRDEIMTKYHDDYPHYDFHKNMGYGTKKHKDAIFENGMTPIHRRSFNTSLQLNLF